MVHLQMPEKKGENEANPDAHPPGHEKERLAPKCLELLQHHQPLRQLFVRLGEHPRLHTKIIIIK